MGNDPYAALNTDLLTEILKELRTIRQLLDGGTEPRERDPWSWPDRVQMEKYGETTGPLEPAMAFPSHLIERAMQEHRAPLVHRVCPVFEDCEGYETQRHDAVGAFVVHLRDRHGEWYEKFARQAAHDNETE